VGQEADDREKKKKNKTPTVASDGMIDHHGEA
jgi:hypothetical protein